MAKTADQIRLRALQEIGVLAAGQSLAIEDAEAVDVSAAAATLAAERVIDLSAAVLADAIEDEYYIPFAQYVGAVHASVFGVGAGAAMEMLAKDKLRKIADRVRPALPVGLGVPLGPRRGW